MPSRRAVLACVLGTTSAGCLGVFSGCREEINVDAERVDPVEELTTGVSALDDSALARRVIREGRVDVAQLHGPSLEDGRYVVHDGVFYRLARRTAATEQVPALRVDLVWENGQTPPDGETAVAFTDLPSVDRTALRGAVYEGNEGDGELPRESMHVRDHSLAYPAGLADSRLASLDHAWIEWDRRYWELTVHGETEREVDTYRYTAREIATDPAAFRAEHPDVSDLTVEDLSAGERSIVETAIEEEHGYDECIDDGWSDALERLHGRFSDGDRREPVRVFLTSDRAWYELSIGLVVHEF